MDSNCSNAGILSINSGIPQGGILYVNSIQATTINTQTAALGWNYFAYQYTDSNGCENTAQDSLYIDGCTGFNFIVENQNWIIYPNPASSSITIMSDAACCQQILLYDMLGNEILSAFKNANTLQLDISHFAKGNYILKIMDGDKMIGVSRVVKM